MVLARVTRGELVESEHAGSLVIVGPDGAEVLALGAVDTPMYPRSAVKPVQAAAMVAAGLVLPPPLLALAASSHSGEPFHLEGVREILAGARLDAGALQTPPALPLDPAAAAAWLAQGGEPEPVAMNCSGKHAAMLATCVLRRWPTGSYRAPDQPLQQAIRTRLEDLAGEPVAGTSVDGCGAPLFAISLRGLARAFGRLATSAPGSPEGQVAAAARAHPRWLGGTGRDVTRMIEALPGLVAKDGAEGVFAAALPAGGAVALKIADGSSRARAPVMLAGLRSLGVRVPPELDDLAEPDVFGGGTAVGRVTATPLP